MVARIVIKCIKIKNKKYHIVETFNRKMVEREREREQISILHLKSLNINQSKK